MSEGQRRQLIELVKAGYEAFYAWTPPTPEESERWRELVAEINS